MDKDNCLFKYLPTGMDNLLIRLKLINLIHGNYALEDQT